MRRNDTKKRIVRAAIDLFSEKGYTETGLRELAARVGIKESSLYNHFPSKGTILEHIIELYKINIIRNTIQKEDVPMLAEELSAVDLLNRLFFTFSLDDEYDYLKIIKILFHEQYRNDKVGEYILQGLIKEVEELFESVLDKLMEKNKIQPVNSKVFSKLLTSLQITYALERGHGIADTDEDYYTVPMFECIEFLIDLAITGEMKRDNI